MSVTNFKPDYLPPFDTLGLFTYLRTYARRHDDGDPHSTIEPFNECLERVITACNAQLGVGFSVDEQQEVFDLFYNLKCLCAGRFLWQLGTKTINDLGLMSLQNCAYVTIDEPIEPFIWAMDSLMLGVGVGYGVDDVDVAKLPAVKPVKITRKETKDADYIVPDSREGWIKLLGKVLKAHFYSGKSFTYSCILLRSKGAPIKGFGGVASGPEVLCEGMEKISAVLSSRAGQKIRPIDALDIMNLIGQIVVSGNVRRSAQIALGNCKNQEFIRAKRWDLGPIPNYRCYSNNSVICNDIDEILDNDEFWSGYKGNGEPYGLINMDLTRKCGRIGDDRYPDPDAQGFNPCLTADTWIMTSSGAKQISELIGVETTVIVNGKEYQTTDAGFFPTGTQNVFKLTTVEGYEVRGTANHQIMTTKGWIALGDLQTGDNVTLHAHSYKWNDEGGIDDEGYLLGQLIGDGTFSNNRAVISSWGDASAEPRAKILEIVESMPHSAAFNGWSHIQERDEYRIRTNALTELAAQYGVVQGNKKITSHIEKASYEFYQGFLRGLFDADGSVQGTQNKGVSIRLSQSNLPMLSAVQRMLARMGIICSIHKRRNAGKELLPDGNGGKKEYKTKTKYEIIITKSAMAEYECKIGFVEQHKRNKLRNSLAVYKRAISRTKFQARVLAVTKDGTEDVYDCTVPEISAFDANGLYVHNCAEQPLENKETCCLAEMFLPNISSFEELKKCAMYLYRICKHSLTLKCVNSEATEAIVHKNMRIGIGVTGYLQASAEQKAWLAPCYEYLREFDAEYSAQHGFPRSIKLTTCKPSGTLSLLGGTTPGVHPAYSKYYIRRVRISSESPLIEVAKKHGYPVEYVRNFDGSNNMSTQIISFPAMVPDGTILASECTAIDQLEWVKKLQTDWSDNSVSVTVTFKPEELDGIKEWLRANYNNSVKSVSFLLHSGHGFQQAPYEPISKEVYEQMAAGVEPIESLHDICFVKEDESIIADAECQGGMCPLR
jgi:ribonucleotide reductase, class II